VNTLPIAIVSSSDRSICGGGVQLTRLLSWQAFCGQQAREVTLVVFAESGAAIAGYEAAGMQESGHEAHEVPAYGRRATALGMTANGLR